MGDLNDLLSLGLGLGERHVLKSSGHGIPVLIKVQLVDAVQMLIFAEPDAGVFQSGNVERLTDAVSLENVGTEQLVGGGIQLNPPVIHENDAVHVAIEHILKPVLDDENGFVMLLVHLIDEINGGHAHGGVKGRKRFVKEEGFHVVVHDTGKGDLLLLTAGEAVRKGIEKGIHADDFGNCIYLFQHLRPGDGVVFQGKSNIFTNRQTNKLGV